MVAKPTAAVSLTLVLGLVLGSLPLPSAGATPSPLRADAGDSLRAGPGDLLSISGHVAGGTPPYTVAWSYEGSGARFADPAALATTFDTAGLSGPTNVTLTVQDSLGEVATDTVAEAVAATSTLLDFYNNVLFGVPDELVLNGGPDQRMTPFTVAAGTTRLEAKLDWENRNGGFPVTGNDFDFELIAPSGTSATGTEGATSNKPEYAAVDNPAPGAWKARVEPFLTTPDAYRIQVSGFSTAALPNPWVDGPYAFGAEDSQALYGYNAGPTDTGTWDLDGDGVFEAQGVAVTASLPVGDHAVRFRVTAANNLRASFETRVTVRADADQVLRLDCGGHPARQIWSMEFGQTHGTCWIHGGHHTYYLGPGAYTLLGGTAFVFSVEHQLTVPSEHDVAAAPAAGPEPATLSITDPITLESSLDGQAWHAVDAGHYRYLNDPFNANQPKGFDERQNVYYNAVPASSEPFRFLRFHLPRSATQGLAGYLDASWADLAVKHAPAPPEPALAPGAHAFSCASGDVMEDFFPEHPCWFGGLERYDAPSFYHTYYLGAPAAIQDLSGSFRLAPWRSDDWFSPVNTSGGANAYAAQVTTTQVRVLTSLDGVSWTDVGVFPASFGQTGNFTLTLDDAPARFVRLFPDYHPGFDSIFNPDPSKQQAPLHHPEAFFLASDLTVTS